MAKYFTAKSLNAVILVHRGHKPSQKRSKRKSLPFHLGKPCLNNVQPLPLNSLYSPLFTSFWYARYCTLCTCSLLAGGQGGTSVFELGKLLNPSEYFRKAPLPYASYQHWIPDVRGCVLVASAVRWHSDQCFQRSTRIAPDPGVF